MAHVKRIALLKTPASVDMGEFRRKHQDISKRISLLSDQQLLDVSPLVKPMLLRQYNKLMDDIMTLEPHFAVDPCENLPPELFLRCVQESLPINEYTQRLLELTMVSMGWMEFIVSATGIWSYIHIRNSQADSMATIAVFVELSRRRPIYITVWNDPGDEWNDHVSIILPHQHRIQSIELKQERQQTVEHRFWIAYNILRPFQNLSVSTEVHFGDYPSLRLDAKQLQDLAGTSAACILNGLDVSIAGFPLKDIILSRIGRVTTEDTVDQVGQILTSMPNLTSIWFRPPPSPKQPPFSAHVFGVPPRLTRLTCFQPFDENLSRVVLLVADTLRELTLSVSPLQRGQLFDCLIGVRYLQECSIEIRDSVFEEMPAYLPPSLPIRSLKTLSLQGQLWGEPDAEFQPDYAPLSNVILSFMVIYPNVTHFQLENFGLAINDVALRLFLEGLTSLESVAMWGHIAKQNLDVAPIALHSLKQLDFEHDLIRYVDAPNLEWLRISGDNGLDTSQFNSVLEVLIWNIVSKPFEFQKNLHHDNFPALRTIRLWLPALGMAWQMPSLPSLQKIAINSQEPLDQNATMLFLTFLHYPGRCPHLEEIEINGFVEWDILILMLESRNFRLDGTRRIKSIQTPFVPPFLKNPLEMLLSGRYAERPSNEDLSWEAIREILCDPEIPGCIYCIRGYRSGCRSGVSQNDGRFFRMDRFYTGYPEPPQGLHRSTLEWLHLHAAFTERWKDDWVAFGSTHRRRKACRRYPATIWAGV